MPTTGYFARDAGARGLVDRAVFETLADEDHAIAAPGLLQLAHPTVLMRGDFRQEHVVAAVAQRVGKVRQHGHHEGIDQMRFALVHQRHRHRNDAGLARAQAAGDRVDRIAGLLGEPSDALAGGRGDQRAVFERTRDGGLGHPGEFGDIRHLQVVRRLRGAAAGSGHSTRVC